MKNSQKLFSAAVLLVTLLFQAVRPSPAYAAGVVGDGTPESCDEAALVAALGGGGTITFDCGGPVTITFTSSKDIASDTQINGGGLITFSGDNARRLFNVSALATLELSNLTLTGGYVSGENGGAILVNSGTTVKITNSTVTNNHTLSGYGGAIYVAGGTLEVTNSTFSNNGADVESIGALALGGGAIQNNDGTVTIKESTFNDNSVTSHTADGGAIYNGDFDGGAGVPDGIPDVLIVQNSTFYHNRLLNTSGTPSSGSSAGAIRSASTLTITNSTFSNNDSGVTEPGGESGAVTIASGTATLTNNIIANSSAADCAKRFGASFTGSGNLIELNHGDGNGCGTPLYTSDPLLGPLQDNGGPTYTMAPGEGSQAINAISTCTATDQRGVLRPQPVGGQCDIGAYELDTTSPTVSDVTSPNTNGTYITGAAISIDITFNEVVNVTGNPVLTLETGSADRNATYTSGSGTDTLTFTYTVQSGDESTDLEYVSTSALSANGGTIRDNATNNATLTLPTMGEAGSLSANKDLVIDARAPSVTSFTRQTPSSSPTNADSLVFRASFSEPVSGVDTGDFSVAGTTTATITGVATVNSSTYDVTISGGDLAGFNGVVGLNLSGGQNITDLAGNSLPAGEPSTEESYTVDNMQPVMNTIVRAGTSPTAAASVDFTVTFTESVTGVDPSDFGLTTGGAITGASVSSVTGSGSSYTVSVNTGSGNGTIRLDLNSDGSIHDLAGNGLATVQNSSNEVYTLEHDAPLVSSIVRVSSSPTYAASVSFTVTFSESVVNVSATDFELTTTGAISGAMISGVTGSGSSYTVTINTGTGNGTIRLDVPVTASVQDVPGNPLSGLPFTSGQAYSVFDTPTFEDVPFSYPLWSYIERLYAAGITGGCTSSPPLNYCPSNTVNRVQMAVFLLRGIHGSSYTPPDVGTSTGFNDVPITYPNAAWIKQLAVEGITGGCGNGNYCPTSYVTRAAMAIFLLRAKHGASYVPPPVNGDSGFNDVPASSQTAPWIKQLVAEGITSGCGGGNFCPNDPVTRAQMAVFLVRTFSLP